MNAYMGHWVIWLVAMGSSDICLYLWFKDVRRIMTEQKSIVESAGCQLAVSREKALKMRDEPEARAVFQRSEKIYRQAVAHYNQILRKPLNHLPAYLMGFRAIADE